jgi:PmbA protein
MDYPQLARDVTVRAGTKGADQCDCYIEKGRKLTIKVRHGEVESIERAGFRGLGVRIIVKGSLGFGFTTDFSQEAVDDLVGRTMDFARTSTPDPHAGIAEHPTPDEVDLEISDPAIEETPLDHKTGLALACEQAAYDCDSRIKYTYGASYGDQSGSVILARMGTDPIRYDATRVDMSCIPVAEHGGERRMGVWYCSERFLSDMEPAATVGDVAAKRAVAMLGARSVPTQKASVIFDPSTGVELVAEIFNSLDGENVLRGMSFMRDKMGERVGSDQVGFVDDGRIPRRVGSRPFDAEGIPTTRTSAIQKGLLKAYFYDTRSSRKAGTASTGNARRGFDSIPHIAANNFYMLPGSTPKDDVISDVKKGVLITNLLGFGVNVTTGDYSRGAEGLWIEDGRISHPVDGITIAGNMADMLKGIAAIASDLRFFGRIGSPTFVIDRMTIAGD